MYDPDSGAVVYGSFDDLKSVNLNIFRKQVAYVSSDPVILKGSVI